MTALTLHDVTVSYADGDSRLVAVDDVSLSVEPGEFVTVVGPSGSGKSSLLAVAGLLLTPDSGTVTIGDRVVTADERTEAARCRREQIGIVFQQSNLISSLTAAEQLEMAARINGRKGAQVRARAMELLESVGLTDAAGRRPHQLSGGQRQRVGIARALMNDPALLLVDEPTSALDHERGEQIVDLIGQVTRDQRVGTVMVTHDHTTLRAADRVLELVDGRLEETDLAGSTAA